jgi:hypothetical protein
MGRVTQRMRINVELQGFLGLSDCEIRDIYYWLRLAPFVACAWTAAGVITESPVLFWALALVSVVGAIFRRHPLDAFYLRVVRPRRRRAAIPAYPAPLRFTCALSALSLMATGTWFAIGAGRPALVLGVGTVAVMAVQVVTGYCAPAAIYCRLRHLFGVGVGGGSEEGQSRV